MIDIISKKYSNMDSTFIKNLLEVNSDLIFVGAGSSHFAGSILASLVEKKYNKRCYCIVASELKSIHFNPANAVFIFLSQSGETADLCVNIDYIKEIGGTIIALCNNVNSTIGYRSDYVFPLCAKEEISVASTKAFTAMVYVGLYLFDIIGYNERKAIIEGLLKTFAVDDYIKRIAYDIANSRTIFFIGKGIDFHIAEEGALKLREIAYLPAFPFYSGELKHGSIALVDDSAIALCISSNEGDYQSIINCCEEIKSRNGKVYIVTTYLKESDIYLEGSFFNLIAFVQLIAYHTALLLGRNIDQPRNLAKSVTVL